MEKAYKLLALDMDGTLLNEQSEISKENERWIRAAIDAGITVCFATGRGFVSAAPFAEQLGLTSPMVLVNGGEVRASPDQVLARTTMKPSDIAALRDIAIRHDTWYWGYGLDGVYNRERWVDDVNGMEWLKFGFYSEDAAALRAAAEEVRALGDFETTNSHPSNTELNPLGVTKASGLRQVCGLLGITMADVVACGDSLNDAAMITEAGLGVAMGNAQDAVKRIADRVTLTNEEDGVAHIIREYLL